MCIYVITDSKYMKPNLIKVEINKSSVIPCSVIESIDRNSVNV